MAMERWGHRERLLTGTLVAVGQGLIDLRIWPPLYTPPGRERAANRNIVQLQQ